MDVLSQRVKSCSLESRTSECYICHETFGTGDTHEQPVVLPCSHAFGIRCIAKWLRPEAARSQTKPCPMCRQAATSHRALIIGLNFDRLLVQIDGFRTRDADKAIERLTLHAHIAEPFDPHVPHSQTTAVIHERLQNSFQISLNHPHLPILDDGAYRELSYALHDARSQHAKMVRDRYEAKLLDAIRSTIVRTPKLSEDFSDRLRLIDTLLEVRNFGTDPNDIPERCFADLVEAIPVLWTALCACMVTRDHFPHWVVIKQDVDKLVAADLDDEEFAIDTIDKRAHRMMHAEHGLGRQVRKILGRRVEKWGLEDEYVSLFV